MTVWVSVVSECGADLSLQKPVLQRLQVELHVGQMNSLLSLSQLSAWQFAHWLQDLVHQQSLLRYAFIVQVTVVTAIGTGHDLVVGLGLALVSSQIVFVDSDGRVIVLTQTEGRVTSACLGATIHPVYVVESVQQVLHRLEVVGCHSDDRLGHT